jgi:hypothetical protein
MREPHKVPMTMRYALGWWAALVILWGPRASRGEQTPSAIFISLALLTLIAYVLARIGWRYGWFRKP